MPSNMTQGSQSADLTKAEREQMTKKLQQAMESGDEAQAAQAMAEFGEMIQQAVISEARQRSGSGRRLQHSCGTWCASAHLHRNQILGKGDRSAEIGRLQTGTEQHRNCNA
ncbi:MAG: hypothetical protein ACLU2K_02975 [Clostridia bacterium]